MKFQGRRGSSNINDMRGGGGGGRFPVGGLGIGGILILLLLRLLGGGGFDVNPGTETTSPPAQTRQQASTEDTLYEFASVVLADTEDIWTEQFQEHGQEYHPPQMNIFTGAVQSGCGYASAQTGPFYCPADQSVYLDLSFYDDLTRQLGARGDYAFAYVIAHEVGHHVQRELGVMSQVQNIQQRVSKEDANRWSVALELQADYLAGVVARHQQEAGYLDPGDIEEAISATIAVGDDTLQKRAQGYVVPDSFTHGTAEQRTEWYKRGWNAGDLSDWNTFSALGLQ